MVVDKTNFINKDGIKFWIRICPNCKKRVFHNSPYKRNYSLKSYCKSCKGDKTSGKNHPMYGKHHTKESIEKIKKRRQLQEDKGKSPAKGYKHTKESISKMIESKKGYKHSEETKRKISKYFSGPNHPMRGKHHTEATKTKLRIAQVERMKKLGIASCYNKSACDYLDKLSKEKKWSLQHALNGGEFHIKELGYWVDGYDKNQNIVVEYDEPGSNHFKNGKLNEKNIKRMKQIKENLKCKFFRYNEKTKELKEY